MFMELQLSSYKIHLGSGGSVDFGHFLVKGFVKPVHGAASYYALARRPFFILVNCG
jgi:hypothetical protein